MIQVAKLYYVEGRSQQEIAQEIFTTRSNVSRLLSECVKQRIVEFRINDSSGEELRLQNQLKKQFGLKDAIVVPTAAAPDATKAKLGAATESYLRQSLASGMTLGITWGTTLFHVVSAFSPIRGLCADVVQLVGGVSAKSIDTDGQELTRRFARMLGGDAYLACFPYIVRSSALRDMLLAEPEIKAHLNRAQAVDIALLGIGAAASSDNAILRAGYFTEADLQVLCQSQAVADICGIPLSADGKLCAKQISDRVMGISFEALKKVPLVIGLCTGNEKGKAVCAALKSGAIDVIALDTQAAWAALEAAQ